MEVKKAAKADAETIGYIHSKAWKQAYTDIFSESFLEEDTPEKRKQEFLRSCDSGNISYYIICQDKQVIGIVKVIEDIEACEIASFYILEEYRSKGFGKQVITYVEKVHKKKIVLWVLKSNERARRFYECNGFKTTGNVRSINRGNIYTQYQYAL